MVDDFFTLSVAGLERKLPKVKINDKLAIASFVMFGDTELVEKCSKYLFEKVLTLGADVLICPEAKAIPLTHALARRLNIDYVVARKNVKGYMVDPMIEKVQSITTIGAQTLVLDVCDIEKLQGKNVGIIDDVVSTGGSLLGLEAMLRKINHGGNIATGNCTVVYKAAVLLEEAGYDKDDLVYLEKLPIFKSQ